MSAATKPTGPTTPDSPLTDVDALAVRLEQADPPHLLDVRWSLGGPPGQADYDAGHIPGAVFCDLETVLAAPPGDGGRHPLPAPGALRAALRALGLREGRSVVVYDAGDSVAAARGWWVLRWAGIEDVRVLDGGYAAWVAADRPVSEEPPETELGDVEVRPGAMPLLDADGAAAVAEVGVLLDARAGERYRGEVEPVDPIAGHIPGAVSAPTAANVGADGRFRPTAELAERFGELGAEPGTPVGVYCGSGVSAAHEVLALELVDVPASLYVGSWSDWVSDPSRPVAKGADQG